MSFSVVKVRPLRSLGLYRSTGKHAAPRGSAPFTTRHSPDGEAHHPAHEKTPGSRGKDAEETAA
jgi:hypothetical protein